MDAGAQSTVTREWESVRCLPGQASAPPPQVMLFVACGDKAEVVALAPGFELTIGRGEGVDLRVHEPTLSRVHARVRREGDAIVVSDLGSRNGVIVGGKAVEQVVLRSGDSAALGSVSLSVQLLGGSRSAPARDLGGPSRAPGQPSASALIYKSAAMIELQRLVERVAQRTIPVLLLGETGTGKELVARELHHHGPRRGAPFVVINCAAIPNGLVESILFGAKRGAFTGADRDRPGAFEHAKGGTLFLDEVGELSAGAQAALLRALDTKRICPVGGTEEIPVDARIVAATHRDLLAMTEQDRFRLDLYHRLNALTLQLPPLRERREEVPALAEHFLLRFALESASPVQHVTPDAMERLQAYDWPGNVRELRNVIERAVALAEGVAIGVDDLPAAVRGSRVAEREPARDGGDFGAGLRAEVRGVEATLIRRALERASGDRRAAAHLLKLPLRTFERKLSNLRDGGVTDEE